MRGPGWWVVIRWCPLQAVPVPSGVPVIQSLECGVWVLRGLADGESSIHAGLCWGLPRLGGRGCRCPPTEGPVAQLGIRHVLGICRCSSLTVPLPVVFSWSVQQCPRRGGTRGGHPLPHSRSGVVDLGGHPLLGVAMRLFRWSSSAPSSDCVSFTAASKRFWSWASAAELELFCRPLSSGSGSAAPDFLHLS